MKQCTPFFLAALVTVTAASLAACTVTSNLRATPHLPDVTWNPPSEPAPTAPPVGDF